MWPEELWKWALCYRLETGTLLLDDHLQLGEAFSASGKTAGRLISRTFPAQSFRTPPMRCRAHGGCRAPPGGGLSQPATPRSGLSRERASLLRASRLITHGPEFHGRSHWDWKVNGCCQRAAEIIARVTRKSRHHRSILGIIRSVPVLGYGLEAPARNTWRRREVWCLSGPCCSEWRALWTEKVGDFSRFPRLLGPRVWAKGKPAAYWDTMGDDISFISVTIWAAVWRKEVDLSGLDHIPLWVGSLRPRCWRLLGFVEGRKEKSHLSEKSQRTVFDRKSQGARIELRKTTFLQDL